MQRDSCECEFDGNDCKIVDAKTIATIVCYKSNNSKHLLKSYENHF